MESTELFKKMAVVGCRPYTITYGTLIDGLCKARKINVAIKLHEEMAKENKKSEVICRPDVVTCSIIIDGFCKVGLLEKIELNKEVNIALYLYRKMIYEVIGPNVIMYNTLLTGLFVKGNVKDTRNLVGEMQLNGVLPDSWTYSIFIDRLCKNGCVFGSVEVAALQATSAFAHEVGLKGLRFISGANFSKQKLYMRNCGMVLTSTMKIMVAAQVHLFKLISLLEDVILSELLKRGPPLKLTFDENLGSDKFFKKRFFPGVTNDYECADFGDLFVDEEQDDGGRSKYYLPFI
ncbi:pentatricopeptide repeat-containing protein At1g62910-like [Pistacia vera]|uniref:pentatricopeptide repeat-containing protein At1g62910-like n=1 Tax=Pistacia vera TaxID=55513 RepID=UPI0012633E33|nr:pentatricopeptide repeat-containing protein At1g62910-like [Pistacia vera]